MTVDQYLFLLRAELTGRLPQEELEDILRYYTEYFEDAGPEGERDVMLELGSPQRLADKILGVSPREAIATVDASYRAIPEEDEEEGDFGLSLPHWGLLLVTVAGVALLAMVGLPAALGLLSGGVVCAVVGLGLILAGAVYGSLASKLLLLGGGLLTFAIGLAMCVGGVILVKACVRGIKWLLRHYGEERDRYEE